MFYINVDFFTKNIFKPNLLGPVPVLKIGLQDFGPWIVESTPLYRRRNDFQRADSEEKTVLQKVACERREMALRRALS